MSSTKQNHDNLILYPSAFKNAVSTGIGAIYFVEYNDSYTQRHAEKQCNKWHCRMSLSGPFHRVLSVPFYRALKHVICYLNKCMSKCNVKRRWHKVICRMTMSYTTCTVERMSNKVPCRRALSVPCRRAQKVPCRRALEKHDVPFVFNCVVQRNGIAIVWLHFQMHFETYL